MLSRYLAALAILPIASTGASAWQSEDLFDQLLRENTYTFEITDEALTGPGAGFIIAGSLEASHVLIGERHATADIPAFTALLFEALALEGFSHAALESGPVGTARFEAVLREDGTRAAQEFLRSDAGHSTIAFLDWQEEADMAIRMVNASPAGEAVLWGVDYEYILSAPLHLPRLAALARNDAQRAAVADAIATAEGQIIWVALASEADFDALAAPFVDGRDEEALEIISELRFASSVFRVDIGMPGSSLDTRAAREAAMGLRFRDFMDSASGASGELPRVLIKSGGFHAARHSRNGLYPPFGNSVWEQARLAGGETFHIYVDCNGGVNLRTGGNNEIAEQPCPSVFDPGGQNSTGERAETVWDEVLAAGTPVVIDLRPFRSEIFNLPHLDERSVNLILGFDVYVALPDVSPATPITR